MRPGAAWWIQRRKPAQGRVGKARPGGAANTDTLCPATGRLRRRWHLLSIFFFLPFIRYTYYFNLEGCLDFLETHQSRIDPSEHQQDQFLIGSISLFKKLRVISTGTIFPSLMYFSMSSPNCESGFFLSSPSSPTERCVRPHFWTMRQHWFPLPAPGPTRITTSSFLRRSGQTQREAKA